MVPLAPKAVEILVALLERQGQVVSKEDLLQQGWPDTFVEEHNLVHYISNLRKVLTDGNGAHPLIETVPKRGYRFVGALQRNGTDALPPVRLEVEETGAVRGPVSARRRQIRFLVLASAPVLLTVLVGAL